MQHTGTPHTDIGGSRRVRRSRVPRGGRDGHLSLVGGHEACVHRTGASSLQASRDQRHPKRSGTTSPTAAVHHVTPQAAAAQVVPLYPPTRVGRDRARARRWSRLCIAACALFGLSQPLAWAVVPDWWRSPLIGSLAPMHAALLAVAVVLLVLALAYVRALDRRSTATIHNDPYEQAVVARNSVF